MAKAKVKPSTTSPAATARQPSYQDGIDYARACIDGDILVGTGVKLACQRFFNMLEAQGTDYIFDPKWVQSFLAFVRRTKHVKGSYAGQSMELAPFQIFIVCQIYGFRDKVTGARYVTDYVLHLPRKNAKSFITSVICLYELLMSQEGATEVYVVAIDRGQARIVFDASQALIDNMSPELARYFVVYRNSIHKQGDRLSCFQALSKDSKTTALGKGASTLVVDEAALVDDATQLAMINGMLHRESPLRIYISTSAYTRESLFFKNLSFLEAIWQGDIEDNPRWSGLSYMLPPNLNWDDEVAWRAVNPLYGISITENNMKQLAAEAKAKPQLLNEFLCRNLNVWVSAHTAWIDREVWENAPCDKPEGVPEAVYVAVDLATVRDLSAVCTLYVYPASAGVESRRYYAQFRCFLPEDSRSSVPLHYQPIYDAGINNGTLVLTSGNTTDQNYIYDYISSICAKENVSMIGYDKYNAAFLVAKLFEDRLPIKEIGQSTVALSPAVKELESLVLNKMIAHNHCPLIGWCFGNVEVYTDPNDNIKLRRSDWASKIDPIIAMAMAVECNLQNPTGVGGSFGFMLV